MSADDAITDLLTPPPSFSPSGRRRCRLEWHYRMRQPQEPSGGVTDLADVSRASLVSVDVRSMPLGGGGAGVGEGRLHGTKSQSGVFGRRVSGLTQHVRDP